MRPLECITIPERGGVARSVSVTDVLTVVAVTPRTSQGWDGHVTLVSGLRIPTVDVHRVLRQVDAIKRAARHAPRGVESS